MFKKFSASSDISGQVPVKTSVQRAIRNSILSQWKIEPETLEAIWPKKEGLVHVKCREHISIYTVHGQPLFFQHFDGPFFPTLRLLHQYPYILPTVKIDRGAIRFLLAGANMMCPGLTSKGGWLPPAEEALPAGAVVAIHAEGKEHAVGIGVTKLSTEDIKRINKDVGVETIAYLGDDLWALKSL
ncbi:malignant T cell amplified sequence 1 [Coprinopsis cinerea AmutBmut pab1-1]|nr:malignant T cell amplified sequence 1 [Coprinopsis cinerea AmutBmut pab1-1]